MLSENHKQRLAGFFHGQPAEIRQAAGGLKLSVTSVTAVTPKEIKELAGNTETGSPVTSVTSPKKMRQEARNEG